MYLSLSLCLTKHHTLKISCALLSRFIITVCKTDIQICFLGRLQNVFTEEELNLCHGYHYAFPWEPKASWKDRFYALKSHKVKMRQ
jgi:hypothetical protein